MKTVITIANFHASIRSVKFVLPSVFTAIVITIAESKDREPRRSAKKMEITEITVLYRLEKHPTIPINKKCIFAVFEDGERAISKSAINNIPDWVREPKVFPRFVYDINKNKGILPNEKTVEIECTYYIKTMTLKCTGIKSIFVDMFENASYEMFEMLKTSYIECNILYKASLDIRIEKPWDCNIMADVITNCSRVSRHVSMNEASNTIGNKRMFPVIISIGSEIVKGVIMSDVKGVCKVKLSKLSDPEDAEKALSGLKEVFSIYEEMYDKIRASIAHLYEEYNVRKNQDIFIDEEVVLEGISALRAVVPRLFVSNYTRECPRLPILISESVARNIIAEGGMAIRYPKEDGNWYTAPDGLFVGLKNNRLSNREEYPYLVTCYVSDHMKREKSKTYEYYTDTQRICQSKRRPLPRMISMMSSEYCRTKLGCDIIEVLEVALDTKIDRYNLPWLPQLVKQELWDVDDETIMQAINKEPKALDVFGKKYQKAKKRDAKVFGLILDNFLPCSLTFRYFEELLKISIHVIVINGGVFEPMIPRHEGEYIWSPPYEKNIILFENKKTTYREGEIFYEILMKKKDMCKVFEDDNEIVKYIVSQKKNNSVSVQDLPNDALEQVIDSEGKCRIVTTPEGDKKMLTRPLCLPVTEGIFEDCFFHSYTNKMNKVLEEIGLCTIDCKKTSTEHIKYFPNDTSFKEWLIREKIS